ncbi:MAG: helix-turn-helix domain-containing protein [Woeseia sp.]
MTIARQTVAYTADSLLNNFSHLESGDLDEVCGSISKTYCEHALRRRSRSGSINARYCRASFGTLSFNYLRYGADVAIDPNRFEHFYMLEIPLSGLARLQYNGTTVDSTDEVGSIVSSQGVLKSQWNHDTARLMVQIDRNFLERFATSMLGRAMTQPIEFQLSIDMTRGIGAGIREYILHIAQQLTTNPFLRDHLLVERQIERTIAAMLLSGQPHTYSTEFNAVAQPGAPKYVARAYQFIVENYRQDITIEDLVAVSGVSLRTLYAGFKRYKGVSPMLALKTKRLEAVREDLLDPSVVASVTDIVFRWGFTHLGNFSRDYRKLFGELPSDTLRRRYAG